MLRDQTTTSVDSIDAIIDNVRKERDRQIEGLLSEAGLTSFLVRHYGGAELSRVKTEFLRRDLGALLRSPLDLTHYASLIRELKADKGVPIGGQSCFWSEQNALFQKYVTQ